MCSLDLARVSATDRAVCKYHYCDKSFRSDSYMFIFFQVQAAPPAHGRDNINKIFAHLIIVKTCNKMFLMIRSQC
jgi:hypothetical protein